MSMGYSFDPPKGQSGQFANTCVMCTLSTAPISGPCLSMDMYIRARICKRLRSPKRFTNAGSVSVTVKWWPNFDFDTNILADCFCYLEYREEIKYLIRMFNTRKSWLLYSIYYQLSKKVSVFSIRKYI
jgi:hypothetical protein